MKQYLLIVLAFFTPIIAFSQEEASFSIAFTETPVEEVLTVLEETFDVRFSYRDSDVEGVTISWDESERTLDEMLREISVQSQLDFQFLDER